MILANLGFEQLISGTSDGITDDPLNTSRLVLTVRFLREDGKDKLIARLRMQTFLHILSQLAGMQYMCKGKDGCLVPKPYLSKWVADIVKGHLISIGNRL